MTTFADEVIAELAAPLKREHVKQREQGRGKVSYIEGWLAIAEANRIFGFDGWTRETVMSECCHAGSYEKAVWENGRRTNKTVESYRCTYRARVRVTANGIVREGSGHGHGFADNPGEAHESAEKEAETDAMKRALMTFGNPFGLALYDKAQAEVEPVNNRSAPPLRQQPASRQTPPPADDPFGDDPYTDLGVARGAAPPAGARNPAPPPSADPNRGDRQRAMREATEFINGNGAHTAPARALSPHPEEPPAMTTERAAAAQQFWRRDDYGIDPEVIPGGIGRWDAEMLNLAEAAPNLDAYHKLKEENRAHFVKWSGHVAKPVVEQFNKRLVAAARRLAETEGVSA